MKTDSEEQHPRALHVLKTCRRFIRGSSIGCGILFVIFAVLEVFNAPDMAVACVGVPFVFLLGLTLTIAFFHGVILMLFFVRISLGQIVAAFLVIGTCIALIVRLPGDLSVVPSFILLTTLFGIAVTLIRQDPSGERETPGFIRKEMANRVRDRIRKRRENQKLAAERSAAPSSESTSDDLDS